LRALQVFAPLAVFGADLCVVRLQIAEEIGYRHPEDLCHRRETGCADTGGAPFVLLDLLESQAEGVPPRLLVHPQEQPPPTNPTADMHIDRVWDTCAAPVFRRRLRLVRFFRQSLQPTSPFPPYPARLQRVHPKRKQHSTNGGSI